MVVQIVVIGAGFTGAAAAQTLGKKLKADQVHITVLEKQSHQSMHLGATRACVDPAFVPKMFIPYDKVWGKASGHTTRLEGIATKLEAKQVTVSLCKVSHCTWFDQYKSIFFTLNFFVPSIGRRIDGRGKGVAL